MSDSTNLARDRAGAGSTEPEEDCAVGSGAPRRGRRMHAKLDFENPDEATMQFLEEQWVRFCRSAGLEGEVPDIRAILAEKAARAQAVRKRRRHWLVRPFAAVADWLKGHPDLEGP